MFIDSDNLIQNKLYIYNLYLYIYIYIFIIIDSDNFPNSNSRVRKKVLMIIDTILPLEEGRIFRGPYNFISAHSIAEIYSISKHWEQ